LWNPICVALLKEMSSTGVLIQVEGRYSRISKSDSACTTLYGGLSMLSARAAAQTTAAIASTAHALIFGLIFNQNQSGATAKPQHPESSYQTANNRSNPRTLTPDGTQILTNAWLKCSWKTKN
jgi:hypothetical protein